MVVADDIAEISRAAAHSGLELRRGHEGALSYRTPLFELNALRAAGVGAWLPNWRRGDLLQYIKRASGPIWRTTTALAGFELTLAGVRLRLLSSSASGSATLAPICDGEVFPSVSARAPGRSDANLWTSGNRAFGVNPAAGLRALMSIAAEQNLWPKDLDLELSAFGRPAPIDSIQSLIHKLSDLADREFAEAASIVGVAAWDQSVNDARFLNGFSNAFPPNHVGTND